MPRSIGDFLSNYLRILEAEELLVVEKATGTKPPASDAKIDALRNFISQHSQLDVRRYALTLFLAAEEKLSSRLDVDKALELVAQARQVLERRFTEEAVHAQRLRRVAIAGVALVGLGAVAAHRFARGIGRCFRRPVGATRGLADHSPFAPAATVSPRCISG